jgi:ABC-type branched-subunit amino acid transport system substrate-binding protein
MQAYFNAVNEQGGVHGRQIRLITRDDAYEPEKAISAVKKLIFEDNVFVLAGSVGTPTGLAALPVLTEAQVPLIGMFTGARALREPFNRYVFHIRASYYDETERIVQHLTTLGVRRIAVFYQNDSYGKAGLEAVEHALEKRNLKPAVLATVERNSVDVTQALETLLSVAPEAIVQITTYKSAAALIKRARAKNFQGQFFNVSFVGSHALAEELGRLGHGVVVSVEGLQYAGKNPTREGLINALESFKEMNFGGFTISYSNKDHMGSNFTDLSIIARGGNKFMH